MNEDGNNVKKAVKSVFKSMVKSISITALVVGIILFLLVMIYVVLKDDFDKITTIDSTYATAISPEGNIIYLKTTEDENGNEVVEEVNIEDILADLEDSLRFYIGGTDEEYAESLKYLINAETVTTMPYIDGLSSDELNGRIKFYRYQNEDESTGTNLKEDNRLKFISADKFQALVDSKDKDAYEYFTINEEGAIVIAYGSEETRSIITGADSTEKDPDLTLEVIKEKSGEDSYSGDYKKGFSMSEYTMSTKTIDYTSLVENYIMPTNLLYAFLIQTKDIAFVKEIARLAYETEIAVGIYDNTIEIQDSNTYTYNKLLDIQVQTSLNFTEEELVNISESGKNIKLTVNDLKKTPYSYIQTGCRTETTEEGQSKHQIIYLSERRRRI